MPAFKECLWSDICMEKDKVSTEMCKSDVWCRKSPQVSQRSAGRKSHFPKSEWESWTSEHFQESVHVLPPFYNTALKRKWGSTSCNSTSKMPIKKLSLDSARRRIHDSLIMYPYLTEKITTCIISGEAIWRRNSGFCIISLS